MATTAASVDIGEDFLRTDIIYDRAERALDCFDVRVQPSYIPPSAAAWYRFLFNIRSVYAGESGKTLTR
ncbi:hypothetical protein FB595_103218 [Sphingobium sp. AEW010]|nr:hypothetical protein C7E20_01095 [Sphingobium sp. AEW4]TWD10651.1 hypothetical protein FB595_103218 [Sphingobium sp. AEW010]TWD27944.1 hypothetical protein FB596_10397 [Sphingobium sp. AEW013]TWD28985.1 hypothetical protein FB594_103218 [Sphingobium sp. AEW001]